MTKIVLNSWNEGMDKVGLTKLQMELLKIGLVEAKKNVDDLLNDKPIIFFLKEGDPEEEFIRRLTYIGVNFEILN